MQKLHALLPILVYTGWNTSRQTGDLFILDDIISRKVMYLYQIITNNIPCTQSIIKVANFRSATHGEILIIKQFSAW